jgi:hypothetical protein
MDKDTKELLQKQSAKYIAELFVNHNINCTTTENIIIFNKEQISIETYCFDRNSSEGLTVLQLDLYIDYGISPILESFAGLGKDFESAIFDAFENFKTNSFHTILSAFFTSNFDKEINKYSWNINGRDFEIFSSNIGIRGKQPYKLSSEWLNQFETEVQKLKLDEGTHWIRLFFAQQGNQTRVCEVLLDNENFIPLQKKAEEFAWQKQEDFYSIRVFMILKNGISFERVIKIVGSDKEYKEAFLKLKKMGLSELEIEKAFAFIPEAFGRKLIQDMGIVGTFSNKAIVLNIDNEKIEINLDKEEVYKKSTVLINELTKNGWNDNMKKICFTSASFNTLNKAISEGAKLKDIACENFSVVFHIPSYPSISIKKHKKTFWKFW